MKRIVSTKQLRDFIDTIRTKKILVIGDLMLDEFLWGKVTRISPEAPVPVVHVTHESCYPGGAANVARNLSDFGIQSIMGGILGRDGNGDKLLSLLRTCHISTDGIVALADYPTTVKTRIIARHQQVVRVDREINLVLKMKNIKEINALFQHLIPEVDGIIIEDYGKGFITQSLIDSVISFALKYKKIITVDPNPNNMLRWSGVTLIKPNREEAYAAARVPYNTDEKSLVKVGRRLLQKWQTSNLLITLGDEGMILFHPPRSPYHTPTRAREVFDVSGAGDTAIAFFTAALVTGLGGEQAAEIANHAAGIVVGKLGTATLHPDELIKSFTRNE
jgi:rfaE bifunctional protein kinase chain/domain